MISPGKMLLVCSCILLFPARGSAQYVTPAIRQSDSPTNGMATGWIHVEQIDGVWWMIDPEGRAFFDVAVCAVGDGSSALMGHLQEQYLSPDWHGLYSMQCVLRMREWGFSSLGNWSNRVIPEARVLNSTSPEQPVFYYETMAFRDRFIRTEGARIPAEEDADKQYGPGENTTDDFWLRFADGWRLGTTFRYIRRMPDPFNNEWRERAKREIQEDIRTGGYAEDPHLVAYYTDNELPPTLFGSHGRFMANADDTFAGAAIWSKACGDEFVRWIRKRYADNISQLNAAWTQSGDHYRFDSFEEIRSKQPSFADVVQTELIHLVDTFVPLGAAKQSPLARDLYDFEQHVYGTYFKLQVDVLKEVDPHHLVISNRYAGGVHTVDTWKSGYMGRIAPLLSVYDIVNVNLYPQLGRDHHVKSRLQILEYMNKITGRPIINGECGMAAKSSGVPSDRWWQPKTVDTQKQRGQGFRNIVATHANLPFMVGFQWFKWADGTDDYLRNCGLIDSQNQPYRDMIFEVKAVNREIQHIRRSGRFSIDDINFGGEPPDGWTSR